MTLLVDSDNSDKVLFTGTISASRGNKSTPFNYNLPCDFSNFKTAGKYKIKLDDGTLSGTFTIGSLKEYQNALKLISSFSVHKDVEILILCSINPAILK